MRIALMIVATFYAGVAFSQQSSSPVAKPQVNVKTDAVLFKGGPSLGKSDKVRWDFYKADSAGQKSDVNVGGAYDATFAEKIPPGRYVAVGALGNISREVPFEVKDGQVTEVKADFNAAQLTVIPKRSPDSAQAETQSRVTVSQGDFSDSVYGPKELFVPAGELKLDGRIGPAQAQETITVRAGETVSHDLIIPSGVVVTNAVYKDGGRSVETDNIRFEALSTTETLDGERRTITGTYGPGKVLQMPAGDFVMRARLGKVTVEKPFAVKAGQRTDLTVDLDAGVLAVEITKDLQGTQKEISGRYGTKHQETLHPGNYAVKITYSKQSKRDPKEVQTTVTAAERTELTIAD